MEGMSNVRAIVNIPHKGKTEDQDILCGLKRESQLKIEMDQTSLIKIDFGENESIFDFEKSTGSPLHVVKEEIEYDHGNTDSKNDVTSEDVNEKIPLFEEIFVDDSLQKCCLNVRGKFDKTKDTTELDNELVNDNVKLEKCCIIKLSEQDMEKMYNIISVKQANTFSEKVKLNVHSSTRTGEKPFRCGVCHDTFSQKGNLEQHNRTHTGEKPYKCNLCNYTFSQRGNLKRHIRTHTGEKPYTCSVCHYTCSQKGHLDQHIRTHTGEKPYNCDLCHYKFSVKVDLKRHSRTHTGEKPYNCGLCHYTCSQKRNLNRHVRTHTGEKPYKCGICNYACSRKCNLPKHISSHTRQKPCHDKLKWHVRTHTAEKP